MKRDVVVCPGCARILSTGNNGCPHCGYKYPNANDENYPWRIPPLPVILVSSDAVLSLGNVSPSFLRYVAKWGARYCEDRAGEWTIK